MSNLTLRTLLSLSKYPNVVQMTPYGGQTSTKTQGPSFSRMFFILTLWWPPQIGQNSYGLDIIINKNQTHIISDKYSRIPNLTLHCNSLQSHKSAVLRDGRLRKKSTVFEDGRVHGRPSLNTVLFSPPARPSTHSVALFLATFWPLLASWSRVRQNDLYHRFRLSQTELLSPTCKIATGSL